MLKLYNTLVGKKQAFNPIKNRLVKIYTCGPTVYWYAHLGNLRTYIFEDILRRALKYNGYKIKQVMNITDVEDKIIKKAVSEKKNIFEITKPYTKIFFEDLKKLNIEKPEILPKATAHIKEMISMIEKLLEKGFAYKGEDGSIYFNVSQFKKYGRLSGLKKKELKIGARIASDEYKKEEAQDFVLWKSKKQNEPFWPSPFGKGRPGWHIECSAMSIKYLGENFDIHAGGVDLIFPHHENEIAQSEASTGKKFANFWLHGEHLLVNNQKMSKSLNNIYTLREIEQNKINPLAFRYLTLTSHYRSKLNFTLESLNASQNALNNLYDFFRNPQIENLKINKTNEAKKLKSYRAEFIAAINDDLNTPQAIAIVWQMIKDHKLSYNAKKTLLLEFDTILGLGLNKIKSIKIPEKIRKMAQEREQFRVNEQFIQADLLRKKIESLGYKIEDCAYGPQITSPRHRS
ncbi:cysteine--tRNA ligase [Candidatus Wolfebacteria bacterium RIFCSPLOWO2_01_FULL_38_11]|uniref:Cysteine--tRNA ligase n=2 Tax=Candidatus Wolfeibacteriota TaxID=1752735 RepID=A0A0G0IBP4_9BACT|nr:MAG: Cysteine-tRNA ligase [Candidatus Wolfebacteria bacterium GW2011_GWC1_37_10]OGM90846.1 MAG: cysteine--tRNA ligase [Candidatus Wolfebacteria bacterium RIFCSPLOWO2_01_FULL_38_11]